MSNSNYNHHVYFIFVTLLDTLLQLLKLSGTTNEYPQPVRLPHSRNSQGTLEPLGTNSIADLLATRLVPGFRERMKHPRYLTAMAVGAVICSNFDEDEVAKDELSSPTQVYERHVTSALVKQFQNSSVKDQLIGSIMSDSIETYLMIITKL